MFCACVLLLLFFFFFFLGGGGGAESLLIKTCTIKGVTINSSVTGF